MYVTDKFLIPVAETFDGGNDHVIYVATGEDEKEDEKLKNLIDELNAMDKAAELEAAIADTEAKYADILKNRKPKTEDSGILKYVLFGAILFALLRK